MKTKAPSINTLFTGLALGLTLYSCSDDIADSAQITKEAGLGTAAYNFLDINLKIPGFHTAEGGGTCHLEGDQITYRPFQSDVSTTIHATKLYEGHFKAEPSSRLEIHYTKAGMHFSEDKCFIQNKELAPFARQSYIPVT